MVQFPWLVYSNILFVGFPVGEVWISGNMLLPIPFRCMKRPSLVLPRHPPKAAFGSIVHYWRLLSQVLRARKGSNFQLPEP